MSKYQKVLDILIDEFKYYEEKRDNAENETDKRVYENQLSSISSNIDMLSKAEAYETIVEIIKAHEEDTIVSTEADYAILLDNINTIINRRTRKYQSE